MEQIITDELIINFANYIVENHSTIRATAKEFNIPKSTLHNHLSLRLKHLNYGLYKQVQEIMEENFNVKHIHGGESTKHKYAQLKNDISKFDETEGLLGL